MEILEVLLIVVGVENKKEVVEDIGYHLLSVESILVNEVHL